MKEIMRQYGACIIAAAVALTLIVFIVSVPLGKVSAADSMSMEQTDCVEFENYWRNQ